MPRHPSPPRFANGFGALLSITLAERHMTQADLARAMNLSGCWISRVICGRDLVSREWVDKVATALSMSAEKRAQLHIEAVKLRVQGRPSD